MIGPPEAENPLVQYLLDDAQDLADVNGVSFANVLINYWIVAQQFLYQADAHAVSMLSHAITMRLRGEMDDAEFVSRLAIFSNDLEIAVPILVGQKKRH